MKSAVKKSENLWDISNRPTTKIKLEFLRRYIRDAWLTIWNNQEEWVSNEWYILDLFSGRGKYKDGNNIVYGSPLIFLQEITDWSDKLRNNLKIKIFLVEYNKTNFAQLKRNVGDFIRDNPEVKNIVEIKYYNGDCNEKIDEILKDIKDTSRHPLFALIDPTGLQPKKRTIEKIAQLRNPKDILLNYMLEGVKRTRGVAQKMVLNERDIKEVEIKTTDTLKEFIGDDVNVINTSDRKVLEEYAKTLFSSKDLKVVAMDLPYPNRNDILYYLLFASKKPLIVKIARKMYAALKEQISGQSLFGREFIEKGLLTISPDFQSIERKSLLYKSNVEYGNWTINHVEGCMHGCKFPCYAFMMSKKFGRVKNFDEWKQPKIVSNSLLLLDNELSKYKGKIDFVHLSFMTDPFMYDQANENLVPDIKNLTLKIIERINREGIRVTVLTKGLFPDEILEDKFLKSNEYGITLVSLNNSFKKEFEPYSSPYEKRINCLKKLHDAGLRTWVSIEPYPTPNLDRTSENIEALLEKIKFVNKIIFGKLNYNTYSSKYSDNEEFYKKIAKKVVDFCEATGIEYHIKYGTPYSQEKTRDIFKGKIVI